MTTPDSQSKCATSRRSLLPRSTANSERLQSRGRDQAAALDLAAPAEEQRGDAARLGDRRDPVLVAVVLEAIGGRADQKSCVPRKSLYSSSSTRRQRLDRVAATIGGSTSRRGRYGGLALPPAADSGRCR